MNASLLPRLERANRQIDRVIRELKMISESARQARTVSKIMLISKLEHLDTLAREVEQTLELMTRDARIEEAKIAAIPQQGSWYRAVEPLIRRCEVAVAVGGDAIWNSIGAQAHAELLKEMARILDAHRCPAIPGGQA